jgi:hypothetical protein
VIILITFSGFAFPGTEKLVVGVQSCVISIIGFHNYCITRFLSKDVLGGNFFHSSIPSDMTDSGWWIVPL